MRLLANLAALSALGLGLTLTVPAHAQTADQDVKCLMVGNIFSQTEKDAGKQKMASTATLFYLGRVDARLTTAQLRTAMVAQAKTISATNAGPIMTECARTMQQKMAALQAMSKAAAAK